MKRQRKAKGTLFLVIGPSQVGKDAIIKRLLQRKSLKLRKVVTVTTRIRRPGEVPGQTYHYVSDEEFSRRLKRGEFLEWARVQTHRSGTPRRPLWQWLARGQNAVQHIDVKGADALRRVRGLSIVSIFILPGSLRELRRRFDRRRFPPREARVRWRTTLRELKKQAEYDWRVVNIEGQLDRAVDEVADIIKAIR